jgi:SAM-dependent methyltransferase
MLSEFDINNIYEKVKLPDSYYTKYENCINIDASLQNSDYPRVVSLYDFEEWVNKYELNTLKIIGTTYKDDPEFKFFKENQIIELKYPYYDLHKYYDDYENMFDLFIFCQTLEHLYNPLLALKNIYKYVKSGGYVFTNLPTLNIPHLTPFHYGGFTPMGLAVLFVQAGFEIVEVGQWGNINYIVKLFSNHAWPTINDLIHNNRIVNEEKNVCQCWILARKI